MIFSTVTLTFYRGNSAKSGKTQKSCCSIEAPHGVDTQLWPGSVPPLTHQSTGATNDVLCAVWFQKVTALFKKHLPITLALQDFRQIASYCPKSLSLPLISLWYRLLLIVLVTWLSGLILVKPSNVQISRTLQTRLRYLSRPTPRPFELHASCLCSTFVSRLSEANPDHILRLVFQTRLAPLEPQTALNDRSLGPNSRSRKIGGVPLYLPTKLNAGEKNQRAAVCFTGAVTSAPRHQNHKQKWKLYWY